MYKKLSLSELNRPSLDDYQTIPKFPLVMVLDDIRSMHNVGAAFRTADAFKVAKIYLCGITAQPPHRDIHKAALGATETVNWMYFATAKEAVNQLKQDNYQIIAVEQATNSTPLQMYAPNPSQKIALIFGNEVFGVSDEVMALADEVLEIPQFGTKHSLNVSVSMGVVLWQIVKSWI